MPPPEVDKQMLSVVDILQSSKAKPSIETLFDLVVSLTENSNRVHAKSSRELEAASSTGLSYLILLSIFAGMTRMLCKDKTVNIHWPVDELGTIDAENIGRLFKMLDEHGIIMVSGFPTTNPQFLRHFKERHEVRAGAGVVELVVPEDRLSAAIARRKEQKELADEC